MKNEPCDRIGLRAPNESVSTLKQEHPKSVPRTRSDLSHQDATSQRIRPGKTRRFGPGGSTLFDENPFSRRKPKDIDDSISLKWFLLDFFPPHPNDPPGDSEFSGDSISTLGLLLVMIAGLLVIFLHVRNPVGNDVVTMPAVPVVTQARTVAHERGARGMRSLHWKMKSMGEE